MPDVGLVNDLQGVGAALLQLDFDNLHANRGVVGRIPEDADEIFNGAVYTVRYGEVGVPIGVDEYGLLEVAEFARFLINGRGFTHIDILDVDGLPDVVGNLDGGRVQGVIDDSLGTKVGVLDGAVHLDGCGFNGGEFGVGVVFHNGVLSWETVNFCCGFP